MFKRKYPLTAKVLADELKQLTQEHQRSKKITINRIKDSLEDCRAGVLRLEGLTERYIQETQSLMEEYEKTQKN